MTRRAVSLFGLALLGCSPSAEDEGTPCGDVLTCAPGEFCLVIYPEGSEYGDQTYACEPIPRGCDSFDDMCHSDPPCGEDWAERYCEPDPISVGCSSFGGVEEAVCEQ